MTQHTKGGLKKERKSTPESLRAKSGKDYLLAATEFLRTEAGADIAFIGRLKDKGAHLQTIVHSQHGSHSIASDFKTDGTLCSAPLPAEGRIHKAAAHSSYPEDPMLAPDAMEAGICLPLQAVEGDTIGVLACLCRDPLPDDTLVNTARHILPRVQSELRHYVAEDALREALSQALLLNYSKSMFMANVSHELKNPLSAIIGYASLIRERQVDGKQAQDYATEICASGEHLLTLINDIMSLAMLEISDDNTAKERFDLTDIARTGNRLIRHQAAQKNLRLVPSKRLDPLFVMGDPAHTKKCLMNLLTNAVKYTSQGQVEIEVAEMDDGGARLSVIDTGIGMNRETLDMACAPITDFKNAYDMHQEGAGLGFPTTMLLMERQGARLEVESTPGKGTKAHLVFPPELALEDDGDFI